MCIRFGDSAGHSSVTVLVLLIFLSVVLLSGSELLRRSLLVSREYRTELDHRMEREERARRILKQLKEDPTPEAQSLQDPVWDTLEEIRSEGTEATLEDISSRLNPNWLRPKLLEVTEMKNLFINPASVGPIFEERSLEGFSTDLQDSWSDKIEEENLERFFTLYSWANVNVTHEEVLERLYILRYGENGAAAFRNRIQNGLKDFILWNKEELPTLLGEGKDSLTPLVNTLPQYNVHFLEPLILQEILAFPYREDPLSHSGSINEAILQRRDSGEITLEELRSLINPNEKQQRVLEYLGTQTWFWKYVEETEKFRYYWIFAWDSEQWYLLEKGQDSF